MYLPLVPTVQAGTAVPRYHGTVGTVVRRYRGKNGKSSEKYSKRYYPKKDEKDPTEVFTDIHFEKKSVAHEAYHVSHGFYH